MKFIDCNKFQYSKNVITLAIEINEHQIFDILWDKFSEKIEEPSDIRILIKAAIKSENMGFFHIIWDKFANQIDGYYARELILEFIEKNNIKLLEKFVAISANKLSSSHVHEIIEQAIRINND